MTDARGTDDALTEFVARAEEAASTFMRGDMDRYLELIQHARGYTLIDLEQMAVLARGEMMQVPTAATET